MELTIPQNLLNELGMPDIIDTRDQLPINPNYSWSQLAGVRDINDLTTIVMHHDAIKKSDSALYSDLELAQRIAQSHINLTRNEPKGDAGFPYHVWIRSGKAYLCNNLEDRTYGVASNNGYTIHVCVSGEYAFTDALADSDRRMLMAVCIALKQPLPNYQAVKAHCELGNTDCPGYDYDGIRNDLQTVEMKLQQHDTWAAKMEMVRQLGNQYNYMFELINKGEGDGDAQWGMNNLLDVHAIMKGKKLL